MLRTRISEYITDNYATEEERLWMEFPGYGVFRNSRNKKWFAIIMDLEYKKLKIEKEGKANVLVLKCRQELIPALLERKGFLPAYHMNKKYWISILLDGTAPEEEIKKAVDMSYEIVEKKR